MISPVDITRQAERWWPEVLRSTLKEEIFFPKQLSRIGKVKPSERLSDFKRIRRDQDRLLVRSKDRLGYGYTLHWRETTFRNVGRNRFIDAITFETQADYLKWLDREGTFTRFREDVELLLATYPHLLDWCESQVLDIVKYHGKWQALLQVVDYFLHRHQPHQYYIRELPLQLSSKFIEQHEGVLRKLLTTLLPAEQIFPGKKFAQQFGLKYAEPLLRLRLLDQAMARQYFSGLTDLSIPITAVKQLNLPLEQVIIVENKTNYSNLLNFLTLPQCKATLGVFGSGFRVQLLKEVTWLADMKIYYWGDLDAAGLQILSQLRTYFPQTQAFLMDRATFDMHVAHHTTAKALPVAQLPGLTPDENMLYHYLNEHQLRLEQEFIPLPVVKAALATLLVG